jgi:sensor domain CHASE-containing protein
MQPQDSGFDWMHALSGALGAVIGAVSTVLTWVIKAARMEPTIRAEIAASEARVRQEVDDKIDAEIGHFRTTFTTLREKIVQVEHSAMTKEDFKEFLRQHREDFQQARQETREDFAELKRNIAEIGARKH